MKIKLTLTFDQYHDSVRGAGTPFGEDLLDTAKATIKLNGQVIVQVEDSSGQLDTHATFNTLQEIEDGWEKKMRKMAELIEKLVSQLPPENQEPPAK